MRWMKREQAARVALGVAALAAVVMLSGCLGGPTPTAAFTATPQYAYPPLDVTFDASAASSPNGAIISYAWDFGDGETDTGITTSHTYHEKGIYRVTLVVTDSDGKTGARSMSVEAMNHPPVAIFEHWPYVVAKGATIEFDASDSYDEDGEIVQYIWSFGDGTTGEGMVVEHEYLSAHGSGWKPLVTLTVVDDSGASGSRQYQINVVGCDACS